MINQYINGDLLEAFKNGKFDAIVHGCNCHCNMGAGIAKSIAEQFPQAYDEDQRTVWGDESKLGAYTMASTPHGTIINAYTQYRYGHGINCDYAAIRSVFSMLNINYSGKHIGIPKIGAGLARGDWERIEQIINEVTPDLNITVYVL